MYKFTINYNDDTFVSWISRKHKTKIHRQTCGGFLKRGTPKSSIQTGFSVLNHLCWGIPVYGNPHRSILQTYCGTSNLALLNLAGRVVGVPNKLLVYSWATALDCPKVGSTWAESQETGTKKRGLTSRALVVSPGLSNKFPGPPVPPLYGHTMATADTSLQLAETLATPRFFCFSPSRSKSLASWQSNPGTDSFNFETQWD